MASKPVPAIDLAAAAAAMPSRHNRVAKLIYHYKDLHSAHTDLSTALDMFSSVKEAAAAANAGSKWARHSVLALLYGGVILYARATKTSSNHRASFDLTRGFTDQALAIHAELVDLRDDALAHFGPGTAPDGTLWNEERVLLPVDRTQDARVLVASKRFAASGSFIDRVLPHVYQTLILFQQELERREALMVDAMHNAFETDDTFPDFLKGFRIDAREVFQGHPAGELLTGDRQGIRTDMIWK